jgi:uncharacterized membrane protein YdbT with pleckstrin-like domain
MHSHEQPIWSDRPSSTISFGAVVILFFGALLLWLLTEEVLVAAALLIPTVIVLVQYISLQSTYYELTTERLMTHSGVFFRTIDELELYRIRDYRIEQPLHLRTLGLANIVLITADATSPKLVLQGIPNARAVVDKIRHLVEHRRQATGVRSFDVY